MPPEVLSINGLCKSYTTPVLQDVSFDLRAGEVHALVGENGAGKSTLGRIVTGRVQPEAGSMQLLGESFAPAGPRDADELGVRMVMQELNLIDNLSVAENIYLNRLPRRFGFVDYARLHRDAHELMTRLGLTDVEPTQPIRTLGVGKQQLVEIAAGLARACRVLILDEPTAALTDTESELLFRQIAQLKEAGTAIVYVSHRMEEIQRLADRITVLRDGRVVATHERGAVELDQIVREMVGRDLEAYERQHRTESKEVALEAVGLRRGDVVRDVSFVAHRGEILGFAGLMGSGRTETMRLLFGADRADAGRVYLRGARTPVQLRHPRDAVRQGIALVTENRKSEGLLLPLSIRANVALAGWPARFGFVQEHAECADADHYVNALGVRCASSGQPVAQLSGGNQQKVVLARWLKRDADILIVDEPTRGIDVGARFEIYQLLEELAGRDKTILMVSSDLRELISLCDRIVVLSAGRVAATFTRAEFDQDRIMQAALSGFVSQYRLPS